MNHSVEHWKKSLCCTTQEESCIGIFSVLSLPIFSITAEILHSKYGFTALQMGTGNLKCMTVGSVSLSLISSELNWSNFTCGSDCHQFLTVTTDMGQLTELPCFNVPAQNSCLEEQLLQFSSTKVLLLAVLLISSELNWSDFTHGSNCQWSIFWIPPLTTDMGSWQKCLASIFQHRILATGCFRILCSCLQPANTTSASQNTGEITRLTDSQQRRYSTSTSPLQVRIGNEVACYQH